MEVGEAVAVVVGLGVASGKNGLSVASAADLGSFAVCLEQAEVITSRTSKKTNI